MNATAKLLIVILVVLIGGGVVIGGCALGGYNKAISLDESRKAQWAEIDNQLQRRVDLIDNLVETVKGIAGQEKDIFLGVAEARKSYFQAKSVGDKAKASEGLGAALSRLLVLRETYPELKSNASFLKLQDQLEGTENRLTVARKRYNESVQKLNTYCRKVPGRWFCGMAGVEQGEFFEIEESARQKPKVSFSSEKGK